MAAPFLQRIYLRQDAQLQPEIFPGTLPFVRNLDLRSFGPRRRRLCALCPLSVTINPKSKTQKAKSTFTFPTPTCCV